MLRKKTDFRLKKGNSLFYRDPNTNIIYVRFVNKGKLYKKSTKTTDENLASHIAWQFYESVISGNFKNQPKDNSSLSIGALKEIYQNEISNFTNGTVGAKTITSHISTVKNVFIKAGFANWEDLTLAEFPEDVLDLFVEHAFAQKGLSMGDNSNLKFNQAINNHIRNFKAFFGRDSLKLWQSKGITIPPAILKMKAFRKLKEPPKGFVPLEKNIDARICKLLAASIDNDCTGLSDDELHILPDVPVAVACEMARYCGLLAGEICAIRWDWISFDGNGVYQIDVRYRAYDDDQWVAKGNQKYGKVPLSPERFKRWQSAMSNFGPLDGLIFKDDWRGSVVVAHARSWLNKFYPERRMKLHELRKMAASDYILRTKDPYAASKFIRDRPETLFNHYAGLLADLQAL